jgi:hypothetical protein
MLGQFRGCLSFIPPIGLNQRVKSLATLHWHNQLTFSSDTYMSCLTASVSATAVLGSVENLWSLTVCPTCHSTMVHIFPRLSNLIANKTFDTRVLRYIIQLSRFLIIFSNFHVTERFYSCKLPTITLSVVHADATRAHAYASDFSFSFLLCQLQPLPNEVAKRVCWYYASSSLPAAAREILLLS